jgi:hypothetical protein
MQGEDNLDDLLRELEVKEKNAQKGSNSRVDESKPTNIIAAQVLFSPSCFVYLFLYFVHLFVLFRYFSTMLQH